MSTPPQIPGITELHEIGRNSLVIGYKGYCDGVTTVVEELFEDNLESRLEFFRGSALQTRMAHPGMPPIKKIGEIDDQLYRVREFVEGRPGSVIFTDGPLSEERLLVTGRALSSTLDALHRRGLAHTEIQPYGLRVDSSGLIRFLDTGRNLPLRKPLPPSERHMTLGYLAPEYAVGAPARAESDVYSLGVLLLALALGQPSPEVSQGLKELRHCTLSPAMKVLIRRMVAQNPAERPEPHTVYESFVRFDEINALLGLHTWRPASYAETFFGRHPYPLVGREEELSNLLSMWQKAVKGKGLSVTVLGLKGSGKRRLVEELKRAVKRAGGEVCRREHEAVSGKPTLIVCPSHQGRLPHAPDEPWLRLSLAQAEPVADQHMVKLERLEVESCSRLAEVYLAAPVPRLLKESIAERGPLFPGELIALLDSYCEDGTLRPDYNGWSYQPEKALSPQYFEKISVRSSDLSGTEIDIEAVREALLDLWPAIIEQDQPVQAGLKSLSSVFRCSRVDLYTVNQSGLAHLCASTTGAHRLESRLATKILQNFEPVFERGQLLYPLRFGPGMPGVLAFDGWEEGIPKNVQDLYRLLQWATAPFAFLVSNNSSFTRPACTQS
jgi:hypothetical protein